MTSQFQTKGEIKDKLFLIHVINQTFYFHFHIFRSPLTVQMILSLHSELFASFVSNELLLKILVVNSYQTHSCRLQSAISIEMKCCETVELSQQEWMQ